jgi:hypothetical protein
MRRFLALASFTVLTLPWSAPASAQDKPDLSGTWVMVAEKSDFGAMPAPTSRTDVIEHKGTSLVMKRKQSGGPMGEVESTLTYGIDGKEYQNKAGPNDVTSKLRWEGDVLVIESTVKTEQGDATVVDRYNLSADKKTLTQNRTISIQGQQLAQTIVLAKK